ncbi:MAG: RecQ family ATP-dependent DNA helicase [Pirellulales bacterium]
MEDTATTDLRSFLSRFRLSDFRPGQQDVMDAVMSGADCLCIMPTGGGKSLCYQLPALALGGLTVVVSPLIALMKDQVDSLSDKGIPATFINSSLTVEEQRERIRDMCDGVYSLVYVAPERLKQAAFIERLLQVGIRLLAVDEAHCISEWGHDFRPDYARLGKVREKLGFPPTIALTATATPRVREDIAKQLMLREPRTFITGFARNNLHFECQLATTDKEKLQRLEAFLDENQGAGIIYAATRKRCEELLANLPGITKRKAALYHAGLTPDERRRVQDDFMEDRVSIIVATNAFGMGIDKSDLRFVVHFNIPGTLEAYYQEAGRAGRDGKRSRCLLISSYGDRIIQEFFIDNRHPPREVVAQVWQFLRRIKQDPIEITQQELKEELGLKTSGEGVGASEKILEQAGALERLDSRQNNAAFRIDSDLATLVDLLPVEAKTQRKVMRAIERCSSGVRGERFFVSLEKLALLAEVELSSITRALKEIGKLKALDYIPPFRGRAIHLCQPQKTFDQLGIDFQELDRRKNVELAKLESVISYTTSRRCRQVEILEYFGDPHKKACGLCDNCGGLRPVEATAAIESKPGQVSAAISSSSPSKEAEREDLFLASHSEMARRVLAGVARGKGRYGKTLIAKMLVGSKAADLTRSGLSKLSTFGVLKAFVATEIVEVIEGMMVLGLLRQVTETKFRPLLQTTDAGERLMRQAEPLRQLLPVSRPLSAKIQKQLGGKVTAPAPLTPRSVPLTPPPEPRSPELEWSASETPARTKQSSLLEEAPSQPAPASSAKEPLASEKVDAAVRRIWFEGKFRASEDYHWTWLLFAAGFTSIEVEKVRNISRDQAYDHVLKAAREGMVIRAEWLLSESRHAEVELLVGDGSQERILPLLQGLPDGIKYRDVQLVLLARTGNRSTNSPT